MRDPIGIGREATLEAALARVHSLAPTAEEISRSYALAYPKLSRYREAYRKLARDLAERIEGNRAALEAVQRGRSVDGVLAHLESKRKPGQWPHGVVERAIDLVRGTVVDEVTYSLAFIECSKPAVRAMLEAMKEAQPRRERARVR
jgi:hypothetical protein